MPELPEVETIRRDLAQLLPKKTIVRLKVRRPKMLKPSVAAVRRALIGRQIQKVARRAKMLLLHLDHSQLAVIHLKMTGQIVWRAASGQVKIGGHPIVGVRGVPNRFTHITIYFKDGSRLYFNDVRQFGYLRVMPADELAVFDRSLGPEPLGSHFSVDYLREQIKRRPRALVKVLLLDQKTVAGLGNIYVDESLWYARLKPTRRAYGLSFREINLLHRAIRQVLKRAVAARGTTMMYFVDGLGREGTYWEKRRVYGREGLACYRCGSMIKKVKLGGRGTHYCPNCQK